MTEQKKLTERFQQLKKNGLLDMKFCFGDTSEATVEQVCEQVNRLYKLVDQGRYAVVKYTPPL